MIMSINMQFQQINKLISGNTVCHKALNDWVQYSICFWGKNSSADAERSRTPALFCSSGSWADAILECVGHASSQRYLRCVSEQRLREWVLVREHSPPQQRPPSHPLCCCWLIVTALESAACLHYSHTHLPLLVPPQHLEPVNGGGHFNPPPPGAEQRGFSSNHMSSYSGTRAERINNPLGRLTEKRWSTILIIK